METSDTQNPSPGAALVGFFVHTFRGDGTYQYQGRVAAFLGDGHYLVELYSALTGNLTYSQMATLDDMRKGGWRFYQDEENWRDAGARLIQELERNDFIAPGQPQTLASP